MGVVESVRDQVRSFKPGDRVVGGLLRLDPTDAGYASGFGGFGGFSEYVFAGDHAAMVADGLADEASGWADLYEIQRVVPPQMKSAGSICVYGVIGEDKLRFDKRRGPYKLLVHQPTRALECAAQEPLCA